MTRFGYVVVTLLAAELFSALFAAVAWLDPHPRLIWNASASAPIGLYRLHPGTQPKVGQLVAIMPPPALARFMAERHYLREATPLLKYVAALPGQRVCRHAARVTIDGRQVAVALPHDRHGRHLPVWQGCRIIGAGTLFLLNAPADSLDSRYFGALPTSGLRGIAVPILTRDAPGKPLRWRIARTRIHPKGDPAMQIGSFRKTRDGFDGCLHSLTIDTPVCLVPASLSDADHAPDWRLLRGDAETGIEIGAGWNRTGERAGAYIALQIDDPMFPEPLRANLLRMGQQGGDHVLLWTRPNGRDRR